MTQPIDRRHCPDGCPFLKTETQVRGVIPYYCQLFETYLAFDDGILRCPMCEGGIQHGVVNEGLGLITAAPEKGRKSTVKWAFRRFSKEGQKTFVGYLKQFGKGISVPKSVRKLSKPQLMDLEKEVLNVLKNMPQTDVKQTADRKEIENILKAKNDQFPGLLGKQTNRLIVNLYLVMDNSEKNILKTIIDNPKAFDVFLEKLSRMPRNDTLLKNVRRRMTDIYEALEKEKEEIALQLARQRGLSHPSR